MARREKLSQQDLKLVNDLSAALQVERHTGLWLGIFLLMTLVGAFLFWAYHSDLEEVTVGQGAVIPSSREQLIQSLDGGILNALYVKEGQLVEKDQPLLKMDDTRSSALLRESQAKVESLTAMLTRYRSEAYDEPLQFSSDLSAEIRQRETSAFQAGKNALQAKTEGLEKSIIFLKKSLDFLNDQVTRMEAMVKRGVASQLELSRMQQQQQEISNQIQSLYNQINDARALYLKEANENLVRTDSELAQALENVARYADPVARSEIRSPVRGIVNNIRINTVGGVINAGEEIMEIVPIDETLLVQAYIRPQDVAFIHPGQSAVVKLSAYDYSVYGGLEGKVTLLSPDTLKDERSRSQLNLDANQSYYRVLVETHGSKLTDKNGEELPIIPGMIATVDIKTGTKTVFEYLIRPVTRMKQALRER
ncbi:HlyD family type I secretion periplasmic adaptor subunit [Dichelobacter nodosus]|uniref:Membrane fusion protein (MFP) family protein n=1 Tax=Dichelobacter nodosus (strain VCS1703A) TaxID=246195 RepID=A5EVJ4_DICNV|nr:HlyD family type I secretion periplasmic adaptor subunit [Dichelobacter nodosus]ABQ13469.1 type I secretion membrane fusion protein [Dichelobacter nodosus VCS1703A]AXM45427.1 HlyD family type I secretion periplasmic adaptor subunit [Dichelobacter nodosus]KNZ40031.1 hemolysin secretion protein D [Dichelobacter nodosus]TGA66622.1 HlyD family type I secretion periplasmic adaptor subunit [Dichelobacter nodosus]